MNTPSSVPGLFYFRRRILIDNFAYRCQQRMLIGVLLAVVKIEFIVKIIGVQALVMLEQGFQFI